MVLPGAPRSMDTNQSRPVGRPAKRMSRTFIPLIAALMIPGLWSLRTGAWIAAEKPSLSVDYLAPVDIPSKTETDASERSIELASHEEPAALEDATNLQQEPLAGLDDQRRRQVVGDWEDDYQGHRRLSVRADGTATMRVEPLGIGRRLFADHLQFEIEWTVTDDRIIMITTGGEPKSKTKLIMNLYGTRAEYKLLNLDDRQLLLLDADGKTKYEWRRTPGERGASAP
jgi:hypothetical protein